MCTTYHPILAMCGSVTTKIPARNRWMLADGVATYHSQRSILKVSNTLNNKYDTEIFFGFSYLPLGFSNCQHTIIVKLKIDIQGVLQVCEFKICEFY